MNPVLARLKARTGKSLGNLSAPIEPEVSLLPSNKQQAVKALEVICQLLISDSKYKQRNKLDFESAKILRVIVGNEFLKDYCDSAYPDTCVCGNVIDSVGEVLRLHCCKCKQLNYVHGGNLGISIGFIYRLTSIHPSWLEYGFSTAIYRRQSNGK